MKHPTLSTGRFRDPGLQPERTVLAWGRTMAAMLAVSAIFLRWVQHHGLFTLTLCTVTLLVAGSIYRNQRQRYGRAAQAIAEEFGCADPLSVFGTALAAGALGVLGLYTLTL